MNETLGILEAKVERKSEINFERVTVWGLVFTNAFFISCLVAKLLRWI